MPAIIEPDDALAQFDRFNLDSVEERRLACYALREYYGVVLTNIGRDYLNFRDDFRTNSPKSQWQYVKTRLNTIDDFTVPDGYTGLVQTVNSISNDVDHDFGYGPPVDRVEEARHKAEDWRGWLQDQAELYREVEGELDARETIIRIARQILNSIRRPPAELDYGFEEDQEHLNDQVADLLKELERIESVTTGVSRDLVFLLTDATELERTQERIEEREAAANRHYMNQVDAYREEQLSRRREE